MKVALNRLGRKEIPQWTDKESEARWLPKPPDRPWLWWSFKARPQKFFTVTEAGEIVHTSESGAESWWQNIEPVLTAEWREEQLAGQRWSDCINRMRNLLATGQAESWVLVGDGRFEPVPISEWISIKGEHFLRTGVAEFYREYGYSTFTVKGPVLVRQDFLAPDKKTKPPENPTPLARPTKPSVALARFPYLALMLRAVESGLLNSTNRVPKKAIEAWLTTNWPAELGDSTPTKIKTMATFLRRPEDERGGIHRKAPDQ